MTATHTCPIFGFEGLDNPFAHPFRVQEAAVCAVCCTQNGCGAGR
ncbi:MAG: hypothetical protein WD232_08890 [Acidimicrobiales bacterium]